MRDKKNKKINQTTKKKRYDRPKLIIYGNINQLTKAVGNKGNRDGGSGKTHGSI